MNARLQETLKELEEANAVGLPKPADVEQAPNGTMWHGKKKNDDRAWYLTKNSDDSFTCEC
jgi:hypothetical protein